MNKNELNLGMVATILRKKNREQYHLLALCQFLAVLMVTAFSIMLTSRTVLNVLPEGGDSRKQMYMIFVASLFGCAMFLMYAAGLFFRYKSREIGVFMALGTGKKQVKAMLEKEVLATGVAAGIAGILCAFPLDYILWGIFRLFVPNSEEMVFSIQLKGYLWGISFLAFTLILYYIKCLSYMRRTNLIDLIHEEHKNEPVKDIKSWYGWGGAVLMVAGLSLGYLKDIFCVRYLKMLSPMWMEAIYLLIPVGLYLFLLYTIIHGWGKKNKYRHIISHSMMKFQGRQTVRNMIVIAVLTAAGLFGFFYLPTMIAGGFYDIKDRPYDYHFHYRADQNMITMDEIEDLAKEEKVTITEKEKVDILTLARDGYFRDFDENGHQTEEYRSPFIEESVISQSDYNRIEGENLNISRGNYVYVGAGKESSIYNDMYHDISYLMNYVTGEKIAVSYQEGAATESSIFHHYFVINDEDYRELAKGITAEWREEVILFNVKNNKETYSFAKKLFNEIVDRSSQEVCITAYYDRIEKNYYEDHGEVYWADKADQLSYNKRNNTDFASYWKYFPKFRIMDQQEMITRFAVFLMLFLFIGIIVFASVVLIAYTRSLSIVMNNKQVYKDVEHLGASKTYLRDAVKNQISKVFFVPAIIGAVMIYLFYILIMLFNGGFGITTSEFMGLGSNLVLVGIAGAVMYLIYRRTLHKVYGLLEIKSK